MKKNNQDKTRFWENNDTFSILPNIIYSIIMAPYVTCRSAVEIAFDTDNLKRQRDYSFE